MSQVEVDKIIPQSGTTLTIGDSGDTITIPSGVTLSNSGIITNFESTGIDDNATSTAITIDASENILINTTDTDPTGNNTKGFVFLKDNEARFSEDGLVLDLNRIGSDGGIQHFKKDGTLVGSIGTTGGADINIGSGDVNLRFRDSTDVIRPVDSSGTGRDNLTDLGDSSTRFKDLYLGGGLYVGGTAAANLLDDYEEGTWTPTYTANTTDFSSITYDAFTAGYYTKVGRLVTVSGTIRTDAISGGSGTILLDSLPFTSIDNSPASARNARFTGAVVGQSFITKPVFSSLFDNRTNAVLYTEGTASSASALDVTDLNTGANSNRIDFSFTYFTA